MYIVIYILLYTIFINNSSISSCERFLFLVYVYGLLYVVSGFGMRSHFCHATPRNGVHKSLLTHNPR